MESEIRELKQQIKELEARVAKIERAKTRARIYRLIKFTIIVILGFVILSYLRPVYESIYEIYQFSTDQSSDRGGVNVDFEQMQDLLQSIQ
jgi:hypothetical protein